MDAGLPEQERRVLLLVSDLAASFLVLGIGTLAWGVFHGALFWWLRRKRIKAPRARSLVPMNPNGVFKILCDE